MTINLENKIHEIETEFNKQIEKITSLQELESLKVTVLGRKGTIAHLMDQLKELDIEQKRLFGPRLNTLKQHCQQQLDLKIEYIKHALYEKNIKGERTFDVTASLTNVPNGSLHIYTHLIESLEDIFLTMGFQIVDGPEVETSYHNFDALNIPDDHPARESHDTFWLTLPGILMRTHTSTAQIRTMQEQKPPLAIFSSGRAYRNEATDASHDFMFMQAEALLIDTKASLSNLLAVAQTFLQRLFNNTALTLRVRPGYFPFVEPGLEIDCSCPFCSEGCSICKRTGWIELLGAGLVHPEVLRKQGIDPTYYSGFAMGMGIERLAMIKYSISDIRLFRSNHLRFLKQF